jgi:erythromycin esterase
MAQSGMINLGQLVRQKKGIENTILVGFSTYRGTVIAANQWGAKMEKMDVPPAKEGSWDNILYNLNNDHDNLKNDKIIIFERGALAATNATANTLSKEKDSVSDKNYESSSSYGQRAIGVVYNPKHERFGNYVPTVLSKRYEALIFIDKTNALSPLHMNIIKNKDLPETFPTGI